MAKLSENKKKKKKDKKKVSISTLESPNLPSTEEKKSEDLDLEKVKDEELDKKETFSSSEKKPVKFRFLSRLFSDFFKSLEEEQQLHEKNLDDKISQLSDILVPLPKGFSFDDALDYVLEIPKDFKFIEKPSVAPEKKVEEKTSEEKIELIDTEETTLLEEVNVANIEPEVLEESTPKNLSKETISDKEITLLEEVSDISVSFLDTEENLLDGVKAPPIKDSVLELENLISEETSIEEERSIAPEELSTFQDTSSSIRKDLRTSVKGPIKNEEDIEPFITQVRASDIEITADDEEDDLITPQEIEELSKSEAESLIVDDISKSEEEVKDASEKSTEDQSIFEYSKAPLASVKEISELEKEHVSFYNLLSLLQEIHTPNDFSTAYNIQDRISYLLNHKTLLYHDLVLKLISYLESINTKLKDYYEEISAKNMELKKYNSQISEIKEYKWNTDSSMEIIEENQKFIREEFESRNKNHQKEISNN